MRKTAINILRTAVCIAAIGWVLRGVNVADLASACQTADKTLLLAALGLFFVTPVMQAVRLRRLLASQGVQIGVGESVRLALAGNFMNFAAPIGSTTGDVYKAVYLSRRAGTGWEATTTVFVDRAIGLGTLLLSVAAIAFAFGSAGQLAGLRGYLALFSILIVAAVCGVLLLPLLKETAVDRLLSRLPKRDVLRRMARTARGLLVSPRMLILAVLDTLAIQIAAAGSFLCIALALGFALAPTELTAFYAFFSAGEIVKALPGPPQGLGTMELAYGYFFANWAGASQIVTAAIAIRAVNLICALPGAMCVAWSAKRGAARAAAPATKRDMRHTVGPASIARAA